MHAESAGVWGRLSSCEKSMPVPCVAEPRAVPTFFVLFLILFFLWLFPC